MEKIELTEMPTKEVLEAYLAQIALGAPTTVLFNIEEGKFSTRPETKEVPIIWP